MPSHGKKKKVEDEMSLSEDSETEVSSYETEEETQDFSEGEEAASSSDKKHYDQPTASSSSTRANTAKNKKTSVVDGVKQAFRKRQNCVLEDEEEAMDVDSSGYKNKKFKRQKTRNESLVEKDEKEGEKTFATKKQETPATKKKQPTLFDDSDVDKRFKIGCPQAVNPKKVSVNSNYMVSCKMIEANENKKGGLAYDYAGLIFQRRTKDSKCYEFNMPLSLTPVIINALQYLMAENKQFFAIQNTPNHQT